MRRWIAAAVLATAAAACSDGGDGHTSPTVTSTSTTVAASSTSTSAATAVAAAPRPPASPAEAALAIEASERVVHDQSADDADLAEVSHREQVAYRTVAEHPAWDSSLAEALPIELQSVAAMNVTAGRELRALVGKPRDTMPAWRIVAPAPADELRRYYAEAQAQSGIPWEYLAAVHLVETRFGRIRGTSTAGAKGPMQFLPSTWAAYGRGDIESNHDAILTAARYLAANGGPRDMAAALHHYNPSEHYVRAVTLYADRMRADALSFRGYYHWQVYYWTVLGDAWLREGYAATGTCPVAPSDVSGSG